MYAILDIETTGGSPKSEKITEIAIYLHDGEKITSEFATLINPEKFIPNFITNLTGINNEMVADAPKFYEVAKKIVELTEGKIVVGHNVNFDYNFIKSEFKQLGYDFERQTVCTVKMSRKLLPGYKSYSLGILCENLNISIKDRHRAAGDALATVKLFELLLQTSVQTGCELQLGGKTEGRLKNLNGYLKPEEINKIPTDTGVYYLHDTEGNIIYIGKSKNIHNRILGHLGNKSTRRSNELHDKIAGISFELTGSELIALLKESHEIKKFKPFYNRKQKIEVFSWGIYDFVDIHGYINFMILKIGKENKLPLSSFNSKKDAVDFMTRMVEKHWLCQKLSGLYDTDNSCFHYNVRQCNGACIQKESKLVYNSRANALIRSFEFDNENFLIIDEGRSTTERALVCVENGLYKGYGYLDITDSYLGIPEMLECIKQGTDTKDSRYIIKSWLSKNRVEKLIRF